VNYYLLARDVWRFSALRWNAETSMLKTLAAKHQSTVAKTAARYKAKVDAGDGPRICFEARLRREGKKDLVARFGGTPLRQDRRAVITDPAPVTVPAPRKELITRLRMRRCELCEHGTTVAAGRRPVPDTARRNRLHQQEPARLDRRAARQRLHPPGR